MSQNKENMLPTTEEVIKQIGWLKNNKTPGKDNMPVELIKYGDKTTIEAIHRIIKSLERDKYPQEIGNRKYHLSIYKKEDKFMFNLTRNFLFEHCI